MCPYTTKTRKRSGNTHPSLRGHIDLTVYAQVLPPVVSLLRTHLTLVKLQVPRWRLYMILDPMSMRTHGCGPFEGLLHKPSAGAQQNKQRKKESHTSLWVFFPLCLPPIQVGVPIRSLGVLVASKTRLPTNWGYHWKFLYPQGKKILSDCPTHQEQGSTEWHGVFQISEFQPLPH